MTDVDHFLQNATTEEMLLVKKYIERHKYLFSTIACSYYFSGFIFWIAPFFIDEQKLPADIWYPFSIEPPLIKCTIYLLQVTVSAQIASGIFTDFMIAYMLWIGTAKLELLGYQFSKAENETDVKVCLKRHQKLIQFVGEIRIVIRYILLKCYGIMALTMITGGYQLINHEPINLSSRFILVVFAASLRLYISARPADDLKIMSFHITSSIFHSKWFDQSFEVKLSFLICMQRAQKPLVISVSGFMTEVSLENYALFLSSTLKYFMNLRAVFDK